MYVVQICFMGVWFTAPTKFKTQGDAEWAIAGWKQQNNCRGDACFRTVKQETSNVT